MSGKHHSVKTKQEISRKRLSLNIVGAKCHKWKGGLKQMGSGYVGIKLHPDDFFYPMTGKAGYVMEHRLVMAKHLNRCLLKWEIVHHKNGIRSDNRLENLSLVKCQTDHLPSIHIKMHIVRLENEINNLKSRVTLLEAENILLKSKGISYV
jgi:hypothetical protein